MKHARVTTRTPQEDGSEEIKTDSYYEKLAHTMTEIEKQVPTTRHTILKELINCLELITKENSPEINLKIKAKNGEPVLITKRWITVKESFNRN
jgi:hypothetical protein